MRKESNEEGLDTTEAAKKSPKCVDLLLYVRWS